MFERLHDSADPRLVACHREVMRDTLDAHDRELVERLGFEKACAESLGYLVTADPVDRIHLAFDLGRATWSGWCRGTSGPTAARA